MKNQPFISKSETLEDIVFEKRNKSYGAYDLNRKNRKYLIIAFFISLAGVSSAIALPFINSLNDTPVPLDLNDGVKVEFIDPNPPVKPDMPPPPPPPPPIPDVAQKISYLPPIVVEEPENNIEFMPYEEIKDKMVNVPAEIEIESFPATATGIEEPKEIEVAVPQESASFMGGGLEEFQKWVVKNIVYPDEAIANHVFGKVIIEFCVNSKGDVVDIKFLRKLDPLVDEETLRVISSSPKWIPAKQGGRPVRQRFYIPFSFEMI